MVRRRVAVVLLLWDLVSVTQGLQEGDDGTLLGIGPTKPPDFTGVHVRGALRYRPTRNPLTRIAGWTARQHVARATEVDDLLETLEIAVVAVGLGEAA